MSIHIIAGGSATSPADVAPRGALRSYDPPPGAPYSVRREGTTADHAAGEVQAEIAAWYAAKDEVRERAEDGAP